VFGVLAFFAIQAVVAFLTEKRNDFDPAARSMPIKESSQMEAPAPHKPPHTTTGGRKKD